MNEPKVIYEDRDFFVVDKPAGLLVHKSNSEDNEKTLVGWILERYPEVKKVGDEPEERPGIVHRLDRDTSGVMVVARNQDSFEYLKNLFANREIKKTYLALVFGRLDSAGIIDKPIKIKSGTVKRTVWEGKDEKPAVTEYMVVSALRLKGGNQKFSLLKVLPKTGRTHQIRVHLASINHPIVGDKVYAPKRESFGLKRQFLHAESIEFTDASGKRIKIGSDLPEDLMVFLESLEKD